MKWLFILLLVANLFYLDWEMDRGVQLKHADRSSAIKISRGTQQLELLNELKRLPNTRNQLKLDTKLSVENVNTELLLQSALTSNIEKMVDISETIDNNSLIQSKKSKHKLCFIFGPIASLKESRLLSGWLNNHGIKYKERQIEGKEKQLSWVYLTPHDSKAFAQQMMRHLLIKSEREIKLISEDDLSNAISLGLFLNQAAVNRRLNEIKLEGYKPILIPYRGGNNTYWFDEIVIKNVNSMNDIFTSLPVQFNPLPIDCYAIK